MKRLLHPTIHIYLPEDSSNSSKAKNRSCEANYFTFLFKRRLTYVDWNLKIYPYHLKKEFISKLKKERKQSDSKDQFYIIMDSDQSSCKSKEYNGIAKHIHNVYNEMNTINNKVNLIISCRCWEIWLCMYKAKYQKPFYDQNEIENDVADDYSKTRNWYNENEEYLYKNISKAIRNSREVRRILSAPPDIDFSKIDEIVIFLKSGIQVTYVDKVIKKIMDIING